MAILCLNYLVNADAGSGMNTKFYGNLLLFSFIKT